MTRLATRLQTADARGRRRARPQSGRSNVCFSRLGPPAHSRCCTQLVVRHRPRSLSRPWAHERRCLHAPPTGVGVSRRKPTRIPVSAHRAVARFGLDARRHAGGLPALRYVSGGLRALARPAPQPRSSRGREPALGPRLNKVGSRALRRPAGAGAPSCQAPRLRGLPAVRWRRLPTAARAVVSANPSLHPDDAFELPQLALAEPPRRRVHRRRERGQRVLGVGA